MCGLAGIVRFSTRGDGASGVSGPAAHAIPDSWLDALDAPIAHRGPDGGGRWRTIGGDDHARRVEVALVHRRLSILDHAGGGQPMVARDADAAIAFNGCLYNHRALRAELIRAGAAFQTDHSDTESLLRAVLAWGDDAGPKLEGMYAAAVCRRVGPNASVQVSLLRDAAGEKPLCLAGPFAHSGGELWVFASTMPAIVAWANVAGVRLALDAESLREWLALGWSSRSPWMKVREIGPGETWIVGEHQPRRVFHFGQAPVANDAATRARPFDSAAEVDSAIAACVQARLEADVPLGCFLSGGVDSSLVALHARRALGVLHTFTVRMNDPRYDESAFAEQAARKIESRHTTIDIQPRPAEDLPRLIEQLGLPFADSSLLPTHWVSRAAREHVRVAIGGDGGDELFMGYERHTLGPLLRWRRLLALLPITSLSRSDAKGRGDKLARLVVACRTNSYEDLVGIFQSPELRRLRGERAKPTSAGTLDDIRATDLRRYLPCDLLRKSDAASMAVALEVRSPLLDRDLAARAIATPRRLLLRGGRKGLLREAARMHFARELIDRRKMGFAIPIGAWLRRDHAGMGTLLRSRLESPSPFGAAGELLRIDSRECRRLWREHAQGGRDHGQRLYALLVLSLWAERFAT